MQPDPPGNNCPPTPLWSPEPIIDWLMTEGRSLTSPQHLTAALSQVLTESGLPLLRMQISICTLHPQFSGSAYTWCRNNPEVEVFSPAHSIIQAADYQGSPIETVQLSGERFRCRLSNANNSGLHRSLQTLQQQGGCDYVAYPLRLTHDSRPATWMLLTDQPSGFTDLDLDQLQRIALFLAPVIEVLALEIYSRSLLNSYLGHRSGQRVFDGQVSRGDGELIEAAIWYSDLRDFTAISEKLKPEQLLELLNQYFEIISAAVSARGGEVLRFVGDAVLVIFPSDPGCTLLQASHNAVVAAQAAQLEVERINPQREALLLPSIRYGLGLDVGGVIYGSVGAPDRLDFTVMGPVVNRVARIEALTKQTGCSLLASEPFALLLLQLESFTEYGTFAVQGIPQPIRVYRLTKSGK